MLFLGSSQFHGPSALCRPFQFPSLKHFPFETGYLDGSIMWFSSVPSGEILYLASCARNLNVNAGPPTSFRTFTTHELGFKDFTAVK